MQSILYQSLSEYFEYISYQSFVSRDCVIITTESNNFYRFERKGIKSFKNLAFCLSTDKILLSELIELSKINQLCNEDVTEVKLNFGFFHSTVLTKRGKLYVWKEKDSLRMINNKRSESIGETNPISIEFLNIVDVKSGFGHTVMITNTGDVYAFGDNSFGQIGIEDTIDSIDSVIKPYKVNGFGGEKVRSIACGHYHSLALTETGQVFGWGLNKYKQISCEIKQKLIFKPIIVNAYNIRIKEISCGRNHSLLLTWDGIVYAFGDNSKGALGINNDNLNNYIMDLREIENIASDFSLDISILQLKSGVIHVFGINNERPLNTKQFKGIETLFETEFNVNFKFLENRIIKFDDCFCNNGKFDRTFSVIDNSDLSNFSKLINADKDDFGRQYLVKDKLSLNKKFVVRKITSKTLYKDQFIESLINCQKIYDIDCENIVNYNDLWLENNGNEYILHIPIDYFDKTLSQVVKEFHDKKILYSDNSSNLGFYMIIEIFIQILNAFEYFHMKKQSINHITVKPDNIFFKIVNQSNNFVKLFVCGLGSIGVKKAQRQRMDYSPISTQKFSSLKLSENTLEYNYGSSQATGSQADEKELWSDCSRSHIFPADQYYALCSNNDERQNIDQDQIYDSFTSSLKLNTIINLGKPSPLHKYEYHLSQATGSNTVEEPVLVDQFKEEKSTYFWCRPHDLKFKREYEIVNNFGKGGYGEVYSVINKDSGKNFALKKVVLKNLYRNDFIKEIISCEILHCIKSDFIVKFKDIWFEKTEDTNKTELYILTELLDENLDNVIKYIRNDTEIYCNNYKILVTFLKIEILLQIIRGVKVLHDNGLIHRDLHPNNIMFKIDENSAFIKIIDFDLTTRHTDGGNHYVYHSSNVGDLYTAPEQANCNYFNYKANIYSLGKIFNFMFEDTSITYNNRMLDYNPDMRPDCGALIKEFNDLKQELRDEALEVYQILSEKSIEMKAYHRMLLKKIYNNLINYNDLDTMLINMKEIRDFSLKAQHSDADKQVDNHSNVVDLNYTAAEEANKINYAQKADIYNLGKIFKFVFKDTSQHLNLNEHQNEVINLCNRMTDKFVEKRPNTTDLIKRFEEIKKSIKILAMIDLRKTNLNDWNDTYIKAITYKIFKNCELIHDNYDGMD